MKTTLTRKLTFLTALVLSGNLFAAPAALKFEHGLSIDDFAGKTYLQAMIDEQNGIKAHFDEDYEQEYEIANWKKINASLKNFDKKIVDRVLQAFGKDSEAFQTFSESIAGETFTPANIVDLIKANYKGKGNLFALAHFYALASGAGTLVHINEENYIYNFGYKSGADADDVKSGRSYGAGPNHNANDASDVMLLNELEEQLTNGEDNNKFYETILEVITQSDATDYASLSEHAQTTATDFIAIYTAELDRHLMVNLHPSRHPWENDLAEAAFVSAYSAKSGKMLKEGVLVDAPLKDFWSLSKVSNRSGIGITRQDRRKLQVYVSAYMRDVNPELVASIEELTGGKRKDGDVFRGMMEFINSYDNQTEVKKNAKKLTKAFGTFLEEIRESSDEVTGYITEVQG